MSREPTDKELSDLQTEVSKGLKALDTFAKAKSANARRNQYKKLKATSARLDTITEAWQDDE